MFTLERLTGLLLRAGLNPDGYGERRVIPCPACGADTAGQPTSPEGLCLPCWERASAIDPLTFIPCQAMNREAIDL
jgi:hypothetical protein